MEMTRKEMKDMKRRENHINDKTRQGHEKNKKNKKKRTRKSKQMNNNEQQINRREIRKKGKEKKRRGKERKANHSERKGRERTKKERKRTQRKETEGTSSEKERKEQEKRKVKARKEVSQKCFFYTSHSCSFEGSLARNASWQIAGAPHPSVFNMPRKRSKCSADAWVADRRVRSRNVSCLLTFHGRRSRCPWKFSFLQEVSHECA